jgi:hypothetical protein
MTLGMHKRRRSQHNGVKTDNSEEKKSRSTLLHCYPAIVRSSTIMCVSDNVYVQIYLHGSLLSLVGLGESRSPLVVVSRYGEVTDILEPRGLVLLVLVREVVEVCVAASEGDENPDEEKDGVAGGQEDLASERDGEEHERSPGAGARPRDEHPESSHADGSEEGSEGDDEQAGSRGQTCLRCFLGLLVSVGGVCLCAVAK